MKTRILLLASSFALIGAALLLSSCERIDPENVSANKTITIDFEEVPAPELEADTRTGYHEHTIWWTKDDQVTFCQYASVSGAMTYKGVYTTVGSDRASLSATIGSFNAPDDATDSYYCSVYPRASYTSYNTTSGHLRARINTPATQTPTATSYDPAADLLISNYVENLTPNGEGKYVVQFSYYRQVALGKMSIVNLPSASKITSIVFKAEHDRTPVTLAGAKWYDFTTLGPVSTYTSDTNLTLDYSAQNISGDMTAHFCCYPFELGEDDWFDVIVTTEADEVFTRRVTLSSTQSLTLEAGRATQFTVDMTTAVKTDSWITTNEYNSGSTVKTTYKICYSLKTSRTNVESGKFMAVTEDVFSGISDISAYLDEHGTDLSASTVSGLNEGKTYTLSGTGLTGDTWCVGLVKLVLDDSTVGVAITRIRTDWFTLEATTRAAGGIAVRIYGKDLHSTNTKNYRIIATDLDRGGKTFEEYYTSVLNPGYNSTMVETINGRNGATVTQYAGTTHYLDKTTTSSTVPGTSYTVMIKAVNLRGETKFVYASATAGGE